MGGDDKSGRKRVNRPESTGTRFYRRNDRGTAEKKAKKRTERGTAKIKEVDSNDNHDHTSQKKERGKKVRGGDKGLK